jgi:hypothetical protein
MHCERRLYRLNARSDAFVTPADLIAEPLPFPYPDGAHKLLLLRACVNVGILLLLRVGGRERVSAAE